MSQIKPDWRRYLIPRWEVLIALSVICVLGGILAYQVYRVRSAASQSSDL